jgi:hypothetical protein
MSDWERNKAKQGGNDSVQKSDEIQRKRRRHLKPALLLSGVDEQNLSPDFRKQAPLTVIWIL